MYSFPTCSADRTCYLIVCSVFGLFALRYAYALAGIYAGESEQEKDSLLQHDDIVKLKLFLFQQQKSLRPLTVQQRCSHKPIPIASPLVVTHDALRRLSPDPRTRTIPDHPEPVPAARMSVSDLQTPPVTERITHEDGMIGLLGSNTNVPPRGASRLSIQRTVVA